jgi:prepilin-type N-terminal cleavage/methylation domain-containing protein
MNAKFKLNTKGFTLMEVMAAFVIISILTIAMMGSFNESKHKRTVERDYYQSVLDASKILMTKNTPSGQSKSENTENVVKTENVNTQIEIIGLEDTPVTIPGTLTKVEFENRTIERFRPSQE